jgi:hypothetical protein
VKKKFEDHLVYGQNVYLSSSWTGRLPKFFFLLIGFWGGISQITGSFSFMLQLSLFHFFSQLFWKSHAVGHGNSPRSIFRW